MLAILPPGLPALPSLPGHYGTRSSRPSPQIPELWPLAQLPWAVSFPLTVVVPDLTLRNPDELNELYHLVASVYPRVKKTTPAARLHGAGALEAGPYPTPPVNRLQVWYNNFAWRYRPVVRTRGSQPRNPGSTPGSVTKKEIESEVGAALAAPASAVSAAKGKFKFAESRRFIKKKFEPTFFAMTLKSWQLFSARAIFCACKAQFTNSLMGSSQTVPFLEICDFFSSNFSFSSNNSFFFCLYISGSIP